MGVQPSPTAAAPLGALTIPSFCQHFGVGKSFFYKEMEAGRITTRKAGKRTLIPVAEAERWLAALPQGGAARKAA